MNTSGLRFANKRSNGKEKNLVKIFSGRSTTLSDNASGIILISAPQSRLIDKAL